MSSRGRRGRGGGHGYQPPTKQAIVQAATGGGPQPGGSGVMSQPVPQRRGQKRKNLSQPMDVTSVDSEQVISASALNESARKPQTQPISALGDTTGEIGIPGDSGTNTAADPDQLETALTEKAKRRKLANVHKKNLGMIIVVEFMPTNE